MNGENQNQEEASESSKVEEPIGVTESFFDFVGRLAWGVMLGGALAVAALILSMVLAAVYTPRLQSLGDDGFGFIGVGVWMGWKLGLLSLIFGIGLGAAGLSSKEFGKAMQAWIYFLLIIHGLCAVYLWWNALVYGLPSGKAF